MAMLSAAASPFCRPIAPEGAFCKPEEDPFLLLESSLKAIERILLLRRGLPLRRTWIEQPYGEEEITLLEEEVIPAIQLGSTERSLHPTADDHAALRQQLLGAG